MSRGHEVLAFAAHGPRPGETAPGRFVAVRTSGWRRATRERRLATELVHAAKAAQSDVTVGIRHLAEVSLYWPHGGSHAETLDLLGKRARGRHQVFCELERRALEGGAARVVCVSELVRAEFAARYPSAASRLVVVPNGVDLERFHPRERSAARASLEQRGLARAGEPLVLFLGRNPELKGLPLLLDALALLPDRPWRLLVAGVARPAHWTARWTAAARRAGLDADRVNVVAELDAVTACAGADVVVLPTRRDPCPLVVLEALACGTPVITTERAGSADAIRSPLAGGVLAAKPSASDLARVLEPRLVHPPPIAVQDAARAGVLGRGLGPWLDALEAEMLAQGTVPRVGSSR